MAIVMHNEQASSTLEQYDEVIRRLEAAGHGAPPGRLHHCAFAHDDGSLGVVDIWESREAFEEFGKTLMPIFGEIGMDPGTLVFHQLHNVIEG
jgi:hypothetical protein